jgi:sulfur carrier protein
VLSVQVNGEQRAYASPLSLATLVEMLGLAGKRIAVELNGSVVPRSQHGAIELRDGDQLEVVVAVGGG